MATEPKITVNGHELNSSQAMAVRMAVTSVHSELTFSDSERKALGEPLADAYSSRLDEVIRLMLQQS